MMSSTQDWTPITSIFSFPPWNLTFPVLRNHARGALNSAADLSLDVRWFYKCVSCTYTHTHTKCKYYSESPKKWKAQTEFDGLVDGITTHPPPAGWLPTGFSPVTLEKEEVWLWFYFASSSSSSWSSQRSSKEQKSRSSVLNSDAPCVDGPVENLSQRK